MNDQPIEKMDFREDGSLDVHTLFYTIQGEGPNTGKPAFFVRLYGCNLQCPGCDTDYTSTRKRYNPLSLRDEVIYAIEDEVGVSHKPLIVITGGEPFRQNITIFANMMVLRGFDVQVETNGTLPPHQHLHKDVQIVCSPKTGKMNDVLSQRITALKYVVKHGSVDRKDGLPIRALDHTCSPTVAKPPEGFAGMVYVQPMDEGNAHATRRNTEAAVQSCKAYGHTLQIQTHKVAGLE